MNSSPINAPAYVLTALKKLNSNGYRALAVGGCVRDALLGKEPFDWDVTTSALPEETKSCFEGFRVIETGIKHGTVTVIIEGKPVEITTFRVDGEYEDHRRPDSVSFSRNLEDDLSRRDFTVNAMCWSEENGITDLFGGKNDLENKLIRCVGDTGKRFDEDALRIMRGLRFAAVLGFSVEEKTALAMHEKKELLKLISVERMYVELKKMLTELASPRVLIEFRDVLEIILPQIKRLTPEEYEKACNLARQAEGTEMSLAAFFCALKENEVKEIFSSLKADKKTGGFVSFLIGNKKTEVTDKGDVLALIGNYGVKFMKGLSDYRLLLNEAGDVFFREAFAAVDSGTPVRTEELDINGREISALGFKGREIGYISQRLLHAIWYEGLDNSKESLVTYIRCKLQ